MNPAPVERDERTVAVENAGYRWSWLVLSYGLLGITAYRSFARGEAPWDLLALVVLSGAVHLVYQAWGSVLYARRVVLSVVASLVAALLAAALLLVRR